jgi:hypothetical protein
MISILASKLLYAFCELANFSFQFSFFFISCSSLIVLALASTCSIFLDSSTLSWQKFHIVQAKLVKCLMMSACGHASCVGLHLHLMNHPKS